MASAIPLAHPMRVLGSDSKSERKVQRPTETFPIQVLSTDSSNKPLIQSGDLSKAILEGFAFHDPSDFGNLNFWHPTGIWNLFRRSKPFLFRIFVPLGMSVGFLGGFVFSWNSAEMFSLLSTITNIGIGVLLGGTLGLFMSLTTTQSSLSKIRAVHKKLKEVAGEIHEKLQNESMTKVLNAYIENRSFVSSEAAEEILRALDENKKWSIFPHSSSTKELKEKAQKIEASKRRSDANLGSDSGTLFAPKRCHCTATVQRLGYIVKKILDSLHGKSGKILVPEDLQGMLVSAMIREISPLAGPINRYCELIMRFQRDYPAKLFDMGLYDEIEYNKGLEILVDWKRHWGLV